MWLLCCSYLPLGRGSILCRTMFKQAQFFFFLNQLSMVEKEAMIDKEEAI